PRPVATLRTRAGGSPEARRRSAVRSGRLAPPARHRGARVRRGMWENRRAAVPDAPRGAPVARLARHLCRDLQLRRWLLSLLLPGHDGATARGPRPDRTRTLVRLVPVAGGAPQRVRPVERYDPPGPVAFLEANQAGERYLLATTTTRLAAPIIISSGHPVMAMGGFHGLDPNLTPATLARMVDV